MSFFNRRIQHYRRYRQIVEALIRHGFGYLIEQLELRHFLPFRHRLFRQSEALKARSLGARIRLVMEELGPTFVKLGQALSTRGDILPLEVVNELSRLQDEVPPFDVDQAVAVIEEEIGKPVSEIFASFDREPLAAASIAQVHKAIMPGGEAVVVKVRRPDIAETIETDIDILTGLAELAQERLRPELFSPVDVVEELARLIRRELDFTIEGRHIERFRKNFHDVEGVHIPKVYWDLSTKRLLVMEFIDGVKVSERRRLEEWGIDRTAIAKKGAEAFLKQVMLDGYFHGDPHPGNILVQRDGTLAFIDFGVVGRLDEIAMEHLADMFLGLVQGDVERIVKALIRVGAVDEAADMKALRNDTSDLVDRHYGRAIGDIEISEVIQDVLRVAYRHRIRLPSDFLLLGRAFIAMEGMGKELDPRFNAVEIAEPFAQELMRRRYDPKRAIKRSAEEAVEYSAMLARIPPALERALVRLNRSETEIQFRHRGLDRLITRLDIVSNRISFSVIIGALIVGSSLIIQTQRGPLIFDLPLLGFLGYVVAGIFGMGLVLSILRSGRL